MVAKLSVLEGVRAALAFARANIAKVAGVLVLVMVLNVAGAVAASPFARIATLLATLLAGVMANAALLRLAFADLHPGEAEFRIGPQGFQFGTPEVRLLGALLLLVLFGFIALLFVILVAALLTVGVVFSHGGGGASVTPEAVSHSPQVQLMLSGLVLVFVALAMWVWVRIFTYPAATVAERRVQVFSTWNATKGQGWRIFAAVVLLSLPALASDVLLLAAPAAYSAPLAVLSAAVHAFVEAPLLCGLSAWVYRRLHVGAPAAVAAVEATPGAGLAGPWG